MKRRFFVLAAVFLFAASAALAQTAQERAVTVDPSLLSQGVQATVGALPPEGSQNAAAPFAIVFMTYEKTFHGELVLRGFNKDGKEMARSKRLAVYEKAESGGHRRFVFDRDTRLADVQSFKLEGKSTPIPKDKSFGQKAEEIVNELLQ